MDGYTPAAGSEPLQPEEQGHHEPLLDEEWLKRGDEERARTDAIVIILPRNVGRSAYELLGWNYLPRG